jgi:hypothetical protein
MAIHQHQNGSSASRSSAAAQDKRSLVSSTAQEAKEDLLAGDLELLSGHLEKAKRCHMHVSRADTAVSLPSQQAKPAAAAQQAKQPEETSIPHSMKPVAPAMETQLHPTNARSSRFEPARRV